MLVIYTDGVTEAMNERREQYGEERLIAALKKFGHLHPAEFIESLERDIKVFTGGEPQNDDITVVAIKEKLAADDVLFGIRKRLIDMVDSQGMSVKEACTAMKVSPSTYYKYKKRLELMGDRGLKNKVLRQEQELKRVSLEERKRMIELIKSDPELGAKRITEELNKDLEPSRHLNIKMVYDELRRLGLNTRELRIEYLRRHKLWEEDEPGARKKSREMVEDLIAEVSSRKSADETAPGEPSARSCSPPTSSASLASSISKRSSSRRARSRHRLPRQGRPGRRGRSPRGRGDRSRGRSRAERRSRRGRRDDPPDRRPPRFGVHGSLERSSTRWWRRAIVTSSSIFPGSRTFRAAGGGSSSARSSGFAKVAVTSFSSE